MSAITLLTFIKTAHYWTMVHPDLEIEDDVREMMSAHEETRAFLLLQDLDLGYQCGALHRSWPFPDVRQNRRNVWC